MERSPENIAKHLDHIFTIVNNRGLTDQMSFASGYAEPGYEGDQIVFANWNPIPRSDRDSGQIYLDETFAKLSVIFEKLGLHCEWADDWTICIDCNKALRTKPDCSHWAPSYWWIPGEGCVCQECTEKDLESYFSHLEGNDGASEKFGFELSKYGYKLIQGDLNVGIREGLQHDPTEIAAALSEAYFRRFIFVLDYSDMFERIYSVWLHKSEDIKKAKEVVEQHSAEYVTIKLKGGEFRRRKDPIPTIEEKRR